MTVFLVAFRDKEEVPVSGFMEEWGAYIKGPTMHTEIAFIKRGEPVRAFSLTYRSDTARFDVRKYDKPEVVVEWYEIPDVDEYAIESYCKSKADKEQMSMLKMIRSAMPFENERIEKWALAVPAIGGLSDPEEIKEMIKKAYARPDGEYCASSCLLALRAGTHKLDDVNVSKVTAHDVVVLVQRKLGAIKHENTPTVPSIPIVHDVEDPPWIIRSEKWNR